jgi:hypothetical protein
MEQSVNELQQEIAALRAILDGDYPKAVRWLMTKVDRQRRALDSLQKKGRGHTKEEREELALANA